MEMSEVQESTNAEAKRQEEMKLKSCPNPACGSDQVSRTANLQDFDGITRGSVWVSCLVCGLRGPWFTILSGNVEDATKHATEAWNTLIRPQWVKWHEYFGCTHPAGCKRCSWCMFGFPENVQLKKEPPEKVLKP